MQLLNGTSRAGSVVFEVAAGLALIVAVSVGMYSVQHPHLSQAQQILASYRQ